MRRDEPTRGTRLSFSCEVSPQKRVSPTHRAMPAGLQQISDRSYRACLRRSIANRPWQWNHAEESGTTVSRYKRLHRPVPSRPPHRRPSPAPFER